MTITLEPTNRAFVSALDTPIAPGMCFRVEDATYDDLHLDTDFVEEGQYKIVGWWDGDGESTMLQEIINDTNPPALAFHRLVKNLAGTKE